MYQPLNETQWRRIAHYLPLPKRPWLRRERRGGRPKVPDRVCFNAMLWVVWSGTWRSLPRELCSGRTARRRIHKWDRGPLLTWMWRAYLGGLTNAEIQDLGDRLGYDRRRPSWQWTLETILRCEYARVFALEARRGVPLTEHAHTEDHPNYDH